MPPIFEDIPPIEVSPSGNDSSSDASIDSLFDEPPRSNNSRTPQQNHSPAPPYPAKRDLSTIRLPGLFYDPTVLISPDLEAQVVNECLRTWFIRPSHKHEGDPLLRHSGFEDAGMLPVGSTSGRLEFNDVNQVMLFNRTDGITNDPTDQPSNSSWPRCLTALLMHISRLLKPPVLDPHIWDILFCSDHPVPTPSANAEINVPTRSRQAIINLYHAGEGISDHIDLLDRYGDGIMGVSFGTGCVMRFRHAGDQGVHETEFAEVYLPPRSIIIMTGDARYNWTHGIQGRMADFIQPETTSSTLEGDMGAGLGVEHDVGLEGTVREAGVWIERGMRLSVTFRWLLPGADVVGSKLGA